MHIVLLVLQILLALHTAMGAVWKLSNSAQTVPSLNTIPSGAWLALSGFEMLCSLALLLPLLNKSWSVLASIAAICIALEMLLFSGLHLRSGASQHGHLVYWLIVAALCAFIAYGRFAPRTV